ncbi:MAG TPA: hypothetical protein VIX80_01450 [Candidatus Kapabacteria bacterium]
MNIRDEELVQRYFDHSMSGAQEQNFLIDVAARDDMRMAFRSQLELLKAIKFDKDVLGGTGLVRERTLAALGLTAMLTATTDEAVAAPTFMQNVRGFFTKPYTMLVAGVLAGGLATYAVLPTNTVMVAPIVNEQQIVQPSSEQMPGVYIPEIQNNVSPAESKTTNVARTTTPAKQAVTDTKPAETTPVVNTNGVSPEVKNRVIIRKSNEAK